MDKVSSSASCASATSTTTWPSSTSSAAAPAGACGPAPQAGHGPVRCEAQAAGCRETASRTATLRPYQLDLIERVLASRHRRSLVIAPVGSGKTTVAAGLIERWDGQVVFVADREELTTQAFERFGPGTGLVIGAQHVQAAGKATVVGIHTVSRRDLRLEASLVIVDEAHMACAATWKKVLGWYPEARIVGLTATAYRAGGGSLAEMFDEAIPGPQVPDLIAAGYLAPVRVFARREDVTRDVRIRAGEFSAEDLDRVMRSTVLAASVAEWRRLADNRRTIAFAVSKAHAHELAAAMGGEAIVEDTPREQRRSARARLRSGEVRALVSVDALGVGFDCPEAEVCLMCRPTMSRGVYRQQAGRVMRPAKGKAAALLLDCAGNVARHGLPTSPDIVDLEGRVVPIPKRGVLVGVLHCTRCDAVYETAPACPECGAAPPRPRRIVRTVEGTLGEVVGIEATGAQTWAAKAPQHARVTWARKKAESGWPRRRIAAVWKAVFGSWPQPDDWRAIYAPPGGAA